MKSRSVHPLSCLTLLFLASCSSYVSVYNKKGTAQLDGIDKVRVVMVDGTRMKGHIDSQYSNGSLRFAKGGEFFTLEIDSISSVELKGNFIWHDNIIYQKGKQGPTARLQIGDRVEVRQAHARETMKGELIAFDSSSLELKPGGKIILAETEWIHKHEKLSPAKTAELFVAGTVGFAAMAMLLINIFVPAGSIH